MLLFTIITVSIAIVILIFIYVYQNWSGIYAGIKESNRIDDYRIKYCKDVGYDYALNTLVGKVPMIIWYHNYKWVNCPDPKYNSNNND